MKIILYFFIDQARSVFTARPTPMSSYSHQGFHTLSLHTVFVEHSNVPSLPYIRDIGRACPSVVKRGCAKKAALLVVPCSHVLRCLSSSKLAPIVLTRSLPKGRANCLCLRQTSQARKEAGVEPGKWRLGAEKEAKRAAGWCCSSPHQYAATRRDVLYTNTK